MRVQSCSVFTHCDGPLPSAIQVALTNYFKSVGFTSRVSLGGEWPKAISLPRLATVFASNKPFTPEKG